MSEHGQMAQAARDAAKLAFDGFAPILYDLSSDSFRPVTQDDWDRMMRMERCFADTFSKLKGFVESERGQAQRAVQQ